MTVKAEDLQQLLNKRVTLHTLNDDGSATEREGKVEAASAAGIAFKEKGKSSVDLYEIHQIYEIDALPEAPKKIRQKKLKPIEEGQVRQHLVDRHGMPVSKANELTEAQATELHDRIDHKDLGHRHEAPEATSQEQAIAEAEGDAA
jgi:hypothetical protein